MHENTERDCNWSVWFGYSSRLATVQFGSIHIDTDPVLVEKSHHNVHDGIRELQLRDLPSDLLQHLLRQRLSR